MTKIFAVCVISLLLATTAFGNDVLFNGREASLWKRNSLIYAEVVSVDKKGADAYMVKISPHATLVGNFDPTAEVEISVAVTINTFNSSVSEVPRVGAKLLFVISAGVENRETEPKNWTWSIPSSSRFAFMPNQCPIMPIDGLGDEKIKPLVQKIADIQVEGEAERKKKR